LLTWFKCPGLTSKGAALPDENLPAGTVVAILAEGKETALAVGKLIMDTDEIKKINKGIGIEVGTHLGDGLVGALCCYKSVC
jgi:PUA domain protein